MSEPSKGLRNARAIGWFVANEAVRLGTEPSAWLAHISCERWWHYLPDRERAALFDIVRDGHQRRAS